MREFKVFQCRDVFKDSAAAGLTLPTSAWLFVCLADQHILRDLERRKILVFTPSRRVAGKRVVCNDDWFIVKLAYESDGIIVSNDMYRDLQGKEPEWKRFIEERLLMYSFVNNKWVLLGAAHVILDWFIAQLVQRWAVSLLDQYVICHPDAGLCPLTTLLAVMGRPWRISFGGFQKLKRSSNALMVRELQPITGSFFQMRRDTSTTN